MTKRKLTKRERELVEATFKNKRAEGRCQIIKTLVKTANGLTAELDEEIEDLETKLASLKLARESVLKENKLFDMDKRTTYSCAMSALHPDLIKYDQETDRMLIELLTEETIPVDVKAVLTKALEAEA